MHNIHHFAKNNSQATWSKENFGNFPKKCPHFKDFFFEIANIFGGFSEISNFFSFGNSYLANRF
jgi:hypothetical protein